jgi:tRNA A37 threonylcarbamoyladenosine dehydratase
MMGFADPFYERTQLLFGEQGLVRLQEAHVLVAGMGGVGAFAAEGLARAGIGRLTLIDHDVVSASNINRQLIALRSTVGQKKVHLMQARIQDINPACQVTALDRFIRREDMADLLAVKPDFVLDAIDSLSCKVALVETAVKMGIPVASSMGAGRKIDPSQVHVADISKTRVCALARHMRQNLKKVGITKGVKTVFSTEQSAPYGEFEEFADSRGRVINGSVSYMPAIFGMMLAGIVLKTIVDAN